MLVIPLAALGQAAPNSGSTLPKAKPVSPLVQYSGDWSSLFEGKAWLRLHLELRGDQLTGSLIHPKTITMNDNGELKSISEEQATEAVTESVVNPDGLLLTFKDADTQETDRYMMRVLLPDKETADLKMIGMPMAPGMPKPKPWRLVKSVSAAKSKADQHAEIDYYRNSSKHSGDQQDGARCYRGPHEQWQLTRWLGGAIARIKSRPAKGVAAKWFASEERIMIDDAERQSGYS